MPADRHEKAPRHGGKAPHPLCCPCREVRQYEGERANEHARQLVDDADLLEDGARVVKRRQKSNVAVADPRRVLDEEVGEAISEGPEEGPIKSRSCQSFQLAQNMDNPRYACLPCAGDEGNAGGGARAVITLKHDSLAIWAGTAVADSRTPMEQYGKSHVCIISCCPAGGG